MFFKHREVTEFNELNVGEYTSYEAIDHENNGSHWGWHICWVLLFYPAWFILLIMYFCRPIVMVKLSRKVPVGRRRSVTQYEDQNKVVWVSKDTYRQIIKTMD